MIANIVFAVVASPFFLCLSNLFVYDLIVRKPVSTKFPGFSMRFGVSDAQNVIWKGRSR